MQTIAWLRERQRELGMPLRFLSFRAADYSARPKIVVGDALNRNKLVHYVRRMYPKEAKNLRIAVDVVNAVDISFN